MPSEREDRLVTGPSPLSVTLHGQWGSVPICYSHALRQTRHLDARKCVRFTAARRVRACTHDQDVRSFVRGETRRPVRRPTTVATVDSPVPSMQTPTSSPTTKRAFLHACSQAKYPLALAGAGLSSASGIPTFRGAGGLWREHDPLSLATPGAFRADPSKVWQFYHYRRELCLRAQPNRAHRVLGWLNGSEGEGSRRVFPSARHKGLRLITQNVDGLSRRVGGGGREPLEMYVGGWTRTICPSH